MTPEILDAIQAATAAKAAYWDRMLELEKVLGVPDPSDAINNYLVEQIDNLAVSVDCDGDVSWIDGDVADEFEQGMRALQIDEADESDGDPQ